VHWRDIRGRRKTPNTGARTVVVVVFYRRAKRAEHFSCFRHKILARSRALILQRHRRFLGGAAARQFINFDALTATPLTHRIFTPDKAIDTEQSVKDETLIDRRK